MESALLAALVSVPDLSPAGLRGVIDAVTELAPHLLTSLADRDDLNDDLREHLVRSAPAHLIVALLDRWPSDRSLVTVAAAAHGPSPEIIVLCGVRGWLDLALDLADDTEPTQAGYVPQRWANTVGGQVPREIRTALINAALTERSPRPNLASMSEWEQRRAIERLSAERDARDQVAWRLLEPEPDLWAVLASEGENAVLIRRILLGRADRLTDEVLLSCLPEVTGEGVRKSGDGFFAGIRLVTTAKHTQKWPRLREIAAADLRRVIEEAVQDGWTPAGWHGGPAWREIAALAELSDDTALLTECINTLRDAQPSDYVKRDRDRLTSWHAERATAAAALAGNMSASRPALTEMLPALDKEAVLAVLRHSDGSLHDSCREQLERLLELERNKQPTVIPVPSDDELAQLDDPVSELRKHLRHLRGRAQQRDVTCAGLLGSRFTTPDMLDSLPAHRVLDSDDQAEQVAAIIAGVCADNPDRWAAMATQLARPPGKRVTFRAWLDGLDGAQAPQTHKSRRSDR